MFIVFASDWLECCARIHIKKDLHKFNELKINPNKKNKTYKKSHQLIHTKKIKYIKNHINWSIFGCCWWCLDGVINGLGAGLDIGVINGLGAGFSAVNQS